MLQNAVLDGVGRRTCPPTALIAPAMQFGAKTAWKTFARLIRLSEKRLHSSAACEGAFEFAQPSDAKCGKIGQQWQPSEVEVPEWRHRPVSQGSLIEAVLPTWGQRGPVWTCYPLLLSCGLCGVQAASGHYSRTGGAQGSVWKPGRGSASFWLGLMWQINHEHGFIYLSEATIAINDEDLVVVFLEGVGGVDEQKDLHVVEWH